MKDFLIGGDNGINILLLAVGPSPNFIRGLVISPPLINTNLSWSVVR